MNVEAAARELAADTVRHKREVESVMESDDYEYSNASPVMYFLRFPEPHNLTNSATTW